MIGTFLARIAAVVFWAGSGAAVASTDPPSSGPASTASQAALPAAGRAAVFVPNFWDPGIVSDRPKLDGITSIRLVTVDDYPPFGFTLPDGSLAGFDVDLARALCDELQLSCTIQVRRFDTIVAALRSGAADAAIASMSITEAALGLVDFTRPYYKTPARFIARTATAIDAVRPETIGRRVVGVVHGSAHEAFLRAAFPAAQTRGFDGVAPLRAALKDGAIDLAFGDAIAWVPWLASSEAQACCVAVDGAFTDSRYFGEGAGIAVAKGSGELRNALDYALARVAASGRYGELYLKYFPIGLY